MFKRILVPLDLSARNRRTIDTARELARLHRARVIVKPAAARKIDLIVMGSHKVAPGPPSAGWGTTSYKVGIFCRCPVLLVK